MDKNNMLCSRCKKRLAVIYMTRMENGQTVSEGLCLPCAKELGLKPVDDLMNKMGLSEEDLDKMSDQMMEVMGDMEEDGEDGFEKGGAMPFPFMQNLFGGLMNREQEMATVTLSLHAKQPKRGMISFDKAYVEMYEYPRGQKAVITYTEDGHTEEIVAGATADALGYEVEDMEQAIAGHPELMKLELTEDVMKMMTRIRKDWGLTYPEEEHATEKI